MKDISLVTTVSSGGTWVNRIGFKDTASTAVKDSKVCGCATAAIQNGMKNKGEKKLTRECLK